MEDEILDMSPQDAKQIRLKLRIAFEYFSRVPDDPLSAGNKKIWKRLSKLDPH